MPSHGPPGDILMSTERSQAPSARIGPCHKDNGWMGAGIKLNQTKTEKEENVVKVSSTKGLGSLSFKWLFSSSCIE